MPFCIFTYNSIFTFLPFRASGCHCRLSTVASAANFANMHTIFKFNNASFQLCFTTKMLTSIHASQGLNPLGLYSCGAYFLCLFMPDCGLIRPRSGFFLLRAKSVRLRFSKKKSKIGGFQNGR